MNSKNKLKKERSLQVTNTPTSIFVASFLWLLFTANLVYLIIHFNSFDGWNYTNLIRINRFSLLIWTTVTFFSAIVATYAKNYLTGFRYKSRFMILCLLFTLSVMLLVISNHVGLIIVSWLVMGFFMSRLIGIDKDWEEAKQASKFTQRYFLTGTFFLTVGILLVAISSNSYSISELTSAVFELPKYILIIAALCVICAAIVQSAIYPFHRWLLSAMTSPTPASALMHAGFVNGAGILLSLFATLLFASETLTILFIIGGFTAIVAQFAKLLQVNVKHKLAFSTIAQMGFMIMQCGLGFFNAAVAHLILHGFYKAYLFLSSGEEVAQVKTTKIKVIKIKPLQALAVLIFGVLGAYAFILWTGKGFKMDSSVFLTLVVAITVGQATYNIVKEKSLSNFQKIGLPILLFFLGIGVYALFYNGVTFLMRDMPMVNHPTPLSWVQIIFGFIFLFGFFIMKLGVYKKIPWLYVKLLNLSQPYNKSILLYKSK